MFLKGDRARGVATMTAPLVGAVLGILAVTLLSAPGPAPATSPTPSPLPTATSTATAIPTTTPTPTVTAVAVPSPSLQSGAPPVRPDPDAVPAIWAAIGRLSVLERFRFTLVVAGRNLENLGTDGRVDYAARGMLVRKPVLAVDAAMTFQMVEASGNAAFSATERILLIGDTSWSFRQGKSPEPHKQDPSTARQYQMFLPDGVAQRGLLPFADGYARVGEKVRNGVLSVHYRATEAGLRKHVELLRSDVFLLG